MDRVAFVSNISYYFGKTPPKAWLGMQTNLT
jgi:hypothetical protein